MKFEKFACLVVCALFLTAGIAQSSSAQDRSNRVVKLVSSQPVNQPAKPSQTPAKTQAPAASQPVYQNSTKSVVVSRIESRPVLTNEPVVQKPLVQKTGSSSPTNVAAAAVARVSAYDNSTSSRMLNSINAKLGIPYLYGSEGPNRYDCSGFVWAVFKDAGIDFERTSAKALWEMSVPVEGDDRFKFGTLVFFNRLGHIGIVADKEGFYQASSSKGITYSKFEGYWENRIVGYRRLPAMSSAELPTAAVK
jgi:peptidoglycan endopeptidase LytE